MVFKTRHLLANAVAISLLATTTTLWAQSTAPAAVADPAAATTKLTVKEMLAAFAAADANKDGKLTKQEAAGVPGLVANFEMVDTNHDSLVSKAEFEKAIK
jgi:hypothetical protein